jgi:hypothetical protein
MISKFSTSLTLHMIISYSNLTLISWVTGALLTLWDLIPLKRALSCFWKTNNLSYGYQLYLAATICTSSTKDLVVSFDSKLYHHSHVDFIFSECLKLLSLIRSITLRFSSLDYLYMLYFMLIRSKLECASVVRNSMTSTDANKLERTQQKFASICFYRCFP